MVVAFMSISEAFHLETQLKVLQYEKKKSYFLPENCTINENSCFLVSGTVFYQTVFSIVWTLIQYTCVFVTHTSISV